MAGENFMALAGQVGAIDADPKQAYDGVMNAYNKGVQAKQAEEQHGYEYLLNFADTLKRSTPEQRAILFPRGRQEAIKRHPDIGQMLPESWDEAYLPDLDTFMSHAKIGIGKVGTEGDDGIVSVGENASLYNKKSGEWIPNPNKKPDAPKYTTRGINTVDGNGNPVTQLTMEYQIPEIGGYYSTLNGGLIINGQYPNGVSVEQFEAENGRIPDNYRVGFSDVQNKADSQQRNASMPAPSQNAPQSSQNPISGNAQGFPIGGNERAPAPTPMPSTMQRAPNGGFQLPNATRGMGNNAPVDYGAPVDLENAPPPPIGSDEQVSNSARDIQSKQPNAFAKQPLADEYAPRNAFAPKPQAQREPTKTTPNDILLRASNGDASAKAQYLRMQELQAEAKGGKKVPKPVIEGVTDARLKDVAVKTTLDEIREFRRGISSGEFSMNMLARGLGQVRAIFNSSSDDYVKGSMLKSSLQDNVNTRLMANTGVQTDGDAKRAYEAIVQAMDLNDDKAIDSALGRAEVLLMRQQGVYKKQIQSYESQYPMLRE